MSSMSPLGRSRRRLKGPILTRGHMLTVLILLRTMLWIWKLIHFSSRLTAQDVSSLHTRLLAVLRFQVSEDSANPLHTIRTNGDRAGYSHLKSWLVETSEDGET
jgi:hypothetical protein